jgi:hypothetical protein
MAPLDLPAGPLGDWQRRLQDPLDPSTKTLRAVARIYCRVLRRPWLLYSGAIFWLLVTVGLVLQLAGAELAAELGLRRNAIYKVIFDARRKIRRALAANGYLEEAGSERR